MPKVIVLPDHVASQIAAGEVVDRPASVVKELVENSIDAGATQVEIAVASECRDIRVADDGCGMEPEDAVLAFHRHATSKLISAEDLCALRSLGFRGEALPSIASVARVTCFSRTREAATGIRVDAADGKVTARETGCAPGTAVEVNDIFYNVPARLAFLKKPSTEFAHIHETVQSLAIAHPKIKFQLLNNGEVVLKTSGSGKLAQAMTETGLLSGRETLVPVTHADMRFGMAVYGYLAGPSFFRADRKCILTVINNRPVRCPLSYKALDQAYADLIPRGRHPIAVLTITIDPHQIDVNIHPSKKEVKYSNSSDIYVAILRAVQSALSRSGPAAPEDPAAQDTRITYSTTPEETGRRQSTNLTPYGDEQPNGAQSRLVAESAHQPVFAQAANPRATLHKIQQLEFRDRLPPVVPSRIGATAARQQDRQFPLGWKLIGYLHCTYFLVQTPEGLLLVEQHIAHERVIYERLLSQQQTAGRLSEHSQRLVLSAPLNLTPTQRDTLRENLDSLRKLGFDFEDHGETFACTQVPLELATKDYAASVQANVEALLAAGQTDFELEATKSVACQAAIKNGMPLSESEIHELILEWYHCARNHTCPHGRPISLEFSKEKLYQMFHPA